LSPGNVFIALFPLRIDEFIELVGKCGSVLEMDIALTAALRGNYIIYGSPDSTCRKQKKEYNSTKATILEYFSLKLFLYRLLYQNFLIKYQFFYFP